MIRHIVMWKLKASAEGADKKTNANKAKAMIEGMRGKVQGLLKIEAGLDICGTSASWDLALYSEFADRAALAGYQDHPAHVAVKKFVGAVSSERAIVDYEA